MSNDYIENSPSNNYIFPSFSSIDELKRVAKKAISEVNLNKQNHTGKVVRKSYSATRMGACAAQLLLNISEKKAPRFREGRKPKPAFLNGKDYSDHELSNDRQVIDLHWLFLKHKNEIDTSDIDCSMLFGKDDFDFDLASEIVSKKGAGKLKTSILGLSDETQLELMGIHENHIREFKTQVLNIEKPKAKKKILNKGKKLNTSGVESWANVYVALRLSQGNIATAKKLYGLIVGEEAMSGSSNLMSNKRKQLECKYLDIQRDAWQKTDSPL